MKKLFLDDFREPWNDSWDLVTNAVEFQRYIDRKGCPDVVSFDHDLHPDHYAPHQMTESVYQKWLKAKNSHHKTGHDCLKYLCDYCVENGLKLPKIFIHSQNLAGSAMMMSTLINYNLFYFEEEHVEEARINYHKGEPKIEI